MSIGTEIASAAAHLGIEVGELSVSDAESAFEALDRAFAEPGNRPLWERLKQSTGLQDPDGWHEMIAFVQRAILLAQDGHEIRGFRFESAEQLDQVLGECSGFEFYVTDDSFSYLLAFNHHDFLIGTGAAAAWVQALADRR